MVALEWERQEGESSAAQERALGLQSGGLKG